MELTEKVLEYWNSYLSTLSEKLINPKVEVGIPGDDAIADQLVSLYLNGKKTAASGLIRDYELEGEELPKVGDIWIVLDSKKQPRCIVKTLRVEIHRFDQITQEIAIAEGEGDLSIEYWRKAHIDFFTPYLEEWGIADLDKEQVVTEFYEVVFK